MNKCKVCSANFPITQFVCEYCGHVETERVKQINADSKKEISFQDSMDVIKDNLNALHEINLPTPGGNLLSILRVIVAIQTFGIALIFWKKPKNRFNPKEYNKLKSIVLRNIELLKLSAKGSNQLQDRINVVQNEISVLDHKIKKGILLRRIVTILIIVVYLALIFGNNSSNQSNIEIIPESTTVKGNLADKLEIVIEKYPVFYTIDNDEEIKKLKVKIKLKVIKKYEFRKDEHLNIGMQLKNNFGNKILNFEESKLDKAYIGSIKRALRQGSKREISVNFDFIPKKSIKSLPSNLEKFSLHTYLDSLDIR